MCSPLVRHVSGVCRTRAGSGYPRKASLCVAAILRHLAVRALIVVTSLASLLVSGCAATISPQQPPSSSASVGGASSSPTSSALPLPIPSVVGPDETTIRLRYVALGDSYTIGTSVKARDRWPNQLVRALSPQVDLDLIGNLAMSGATTGDVIEEQLPQLPRMDPDFISLLVGVNDVVRGFDPEVYRAHLDTILDDLLQQVSPARLLLITTPNYTLTAKGDDYGDPSRQAPRVAVFNHVLEAEAAARGIPVVDITPVANLVSGDPSLVAGDGLHPSAKQYAGWVEIIAPKVRQMLRMAATQP